jgi:hypothetical protein
MENFMLETHDVGKRVDTEAEDVAVGVARNCG